MGVRVGGGTGLQSWLEGQAQREETRADGGRAQGFGDSLRLKLSRLGLGRTVGAPV